jgi:bacterioferritin
VLRYKRHYYMASGIHAQPVAQEFLEHASEEQGHADLAAERIVQLGGAPNLNPEGLATRSHSQYIEGTSLLEMIREDLVAERIVVESYNEIIRYLGDDDPTTRTMMERIMANEEEHAEDMKTLLESLSKEEHVFRSFLKKPPLLSKFQRKGLVSIQAGYDWAGVRRPAIFDAILTTLFLH